MRSVVEYLRMQRWHTMILAAVALTAQLPHQPVNASGIIPGLEAKRVRTWTSRGADDGSIHAMGNGEMVTYACGPNISFLYGPPYSSPSVFSLTCESDSVLTDQAVREIGTAIWGHKTTLDGKSALEYTEFVGADVPAYVRLVDCAVEGVRWVIHPQATGSFTPVKQHPGVWIQTIQPGQKIFNYPSTMWAHHWIIAQGSCSGELDSSGSLVIRCQPGKGSLMIVGSSSLPHGTLGMEKLLGGGATPLLASTRKHWRSFTARRLKTRPISKHTPPDVAEALDSAAVLIRSQQSSTGGVMAGPVFAMAYIRDQYGCARGMLALGMLDEAKHNLAFRFSKFKRFGSLMTADLMGSDCARHQHENDEVEGPAYTILQVRDYIKATGDNAFGRKLWPMLKWCWDIQQGHVANGLLPFNGDETYVAGGFYPRSGLLQGSADTTLVYAESGKWLCEWAVDEKLWTPGEARLQMKRVEVARSAYRKWFWDKDRVWANAPEREEAIAPQRFRHGVCEGRCGWFGWTERSKNGRYECPVCLATKELPAERPERMEVNSVSLLPAYVGSDILSKAELKKLVEHVIGQANAAGHIASVPSTENCVGYDPGLILLNALAAGHPYAAEGQKRVMRMLDSAGAWTEYYNTEDRPYPTCCRCRPWESGVNAAALIAFEGTKR